MKQDWYWNLLLGISKIRPLLTIECGITIKELTTWRALQGETGTTIQRSSLQEFGYRSRLDYMELGGQARNTSAALLGILSSHHKIKEEMTSNSPLPSVEHSPKAESMKETAVHSPSVKRSSLPHSCLGEAELRLKESQRFWCLQLAGTRSKEGCYSLLDSFQIMICPVFVTNTRSLHPLGRDPVFVAAFETECAWTNDHMRQALMATLESWDTFGKMPSKSIHFD